jgi:hypothetical protein
VKLPGCVSAPVAEPGSVLALGVGGTTFSPKDVLHTTIIIIITTTTNTNIIYTRMNFVIVAIVSGQTSRYHIGRDFANYYQFVKFEADYATNH